MKIMENLEGLEKTKKESRKHCFFGVHDYKIIDTREVSNNRNDIVGRVYVQQCTQCGKIHSTGVRFYDF